MALNSVHPMLKEEFLSVYCPSIGGTPVAVYKRIPFSGRLGTMGVMPQGVITTADLVVTVAINGTTNTALAGSLAFSGAAAGTGNTWVPTTAVYVSEGDTIKFTPSAASGASIAGEFTFNLIAG